MMEIRVGYPTAIEERQIVLNTAGGDPKLPPAAFTREDYLGLKQLVSAVPVSDSVVDYAIAISGATRPEDPRATAMVRDYVSFGVGPRGSQNLVRAAKARALLEGRTTPVEADIRQVATPVLRHRIITNHRAIGDGITTVSIVENLLKEIRS